MNTITPNSTNPLLSTLSQFDRSQFARLSAFLEARSTGVPGAWVEVLALRTYLVAEGHGELVAYFERRENERVHGAVLTPLPPDDRDLVAQLREGKEVVAGPEYSGVVE
jgi:hypothetical protein